jgi:hypothetical protein
MNIHHKDPVPKKKVQCELHKSNIHGRAATVKLLIIESNVQMCKRWCHNHKTWTSDNRKRAGDMFRLAILHVHPSGRFNILRTPKGAYNPECLVPTVKHGAGSVMVWAAIS